MEAQFLVLDLTSSLSLCSSVMQIRGNTFIVTGGASGLGEATVREFIRLGANVAIFDLNGEKAAEIAKELGNNAFFPDPVDVTSEDIVRSAISATVAKFGKLAGVVNCGGIATAARTAKPGKPSNTLTLDMFTFTVQVNLIGTYNVSRQVASVLVNQEPFNQDGERGVIINTASVAYQDGQVGQAAYSASKGGVASMTLPMARDLSPFGVRVVAIAPGLFQTGMTAAPESMMPKLLKDVEFPRRMGRPVEFAQLVMQIVENVMLNGDIIRLDAATRMGKL